MIMTIGVLFATLWPFDFSPANNVTWIPDANGLRFDRQSIALTSEPLNTEAFGGQKNFTLEILLRPESVETVSTILSFYVPGHPTRLHIKQWGPEVMVAHRIDDGSTKMKSAKLEMAPAFQGGKELLLTMTSSPNGTIVYLNGLPCQTSPKFSLSVNDLAGQIVLGASTIDYDPWQGEIHGLAIYAKQLTPAEVFTHYRAWTESPRPSPSDFDSAVALYTFSERQGHEVHSAVASAPALQIPARFVIPHKPFLKSPRREFEATWDYLDDVLRNILGFLPLGFLLGAYGSLRRRPGKVILRTILACALLSFTIEVLQFYIPQRNSGITDIITNTLGGVVGAFLALTAVFQNIFKKKSSAKPA